MKIADPTPRYRTMGLLGMGVLISWSTAAWSADTAAASALHALLGPQAALQQSGGMPPTMTHLEAGVAHTPMDTPSAATPSAMVGSTVTVKRGETLDRLIRRVLPDMPLHPDFLRKAFVSLNPQVFPTGSPHQMRAGASLKVPSLPALRQMMMSQYPGTAPLLHETQELDQQKAAKDHNDRRNWVRFP